ncbi:hypothetical protein EUGRSUZ_G01397 [Eucalyptus grandis]|uniref:Uncharacterized protein n=2 Tax=Eucalyptus grandis TaxID=71139 RepID=A0ACC3K2W3_EUCGR|nr:hypothetical protein EUGRSUZ_G01397 [Eucalyptus grandis]
MKLFKRAAQFGHLRASYTIGLLLMCEGGKLKKKEGIGLLRKVHTSERVVECRDKYLNTVRIMWWNNTMIFREEWSYDCEMQTEHCKRRGWVCDIDHYDDTECEQCICRVETKILYKYCRYP